MNQFVTECLLLVTILDLFLIHRGVSLLNDLILRYLHARNAHSILKHRPNLKATLLLHSSSQTFQASSSSLHYRAIGSGTIRRHKRVDRIISG